MALFDPECAPDDEMIDGYCRKTCYSYVSEDASLRNLPCQDLGFEPITEVDTFLHVKSWFLVFFIVIKIVLYVIKYISIEWRYI